MGALNLIAKTELTDELIFPDQIDALFAKAKNNFIDSDNKAAVENIRKAVEILKNESDKVTENKKPAYRQAKYNLNELADDLESDKVKRINRLNRSFAYVHHIFAKHIQDIAVEKWARKEVKQVGRALNSATPPRCSWRTLDWAQGQP